ncbi:ankyrin [Mucor ambiguus]|uniref:Ankyrin n=1 Tax=Mucor ambiguus TaxID=91626 RepID=A0A0C9LWM6_9FUNG|nr:ankyrin [Mucor ambiguus]
MLPTSNDAKKEKLKDVLLGLHWAATTGNVGLIKFALDHGVPIDSAVNGFVPLQLACISDNNIAAVQYLIDRGADVNIQKWPKKHSIDKTQAVPGATGSTALHVACANGCIKIVDLLIRNNARIDVKDKYGSTSLDVAQAKHEAEIVKLLKVAREQQRQHRHRSMSYSNDFDENENSRARKSIDSIVMTHKRTSSDKQPRIRRPSLPSIFEGHHKIIPQNIPSFISMTPSSTSLTTTANANNNLDPSSAASRRSFSAHRPLTDEMHTHSCPVTPRTSFDYFNSSKRSQNRNIPPRDRSPRSSEDSSAINYSTSPIQGGILNSDYATAVATADGQRDWYAYGVVNPYDDDNYLLSLERRAYNLASNEEGRLERHSQDSSRRSVVYDDMPTPAYRRQSTASSSDDQQPDPHINTRRSDSSESGNKLRTTALKNAMAANNVPSINLTSDSNTPTSEYEEEGYDGEVDEEEEEEEDEVEDDEEVYSSEPLPRPSVVLDSGPEADLVRYRFLHRDQQADVIHTAQESGHMTDHSHHAEGKKSWFSGLGKEVGRHSLDSHSRKSLDFRPSFENFTQFAKRGVPTIKSQDDDSSDDDERQQQQQRNSFFSRWAPAWSKK